MRQFFLDKLNQLDKLTGIQQMNKLQALGAEKCKTELNELLDILCDACAKFPLIPVKAKESILSNAIVSDENFIGLNAKFVYRALNTYRDKYFTESHHVQDAPGPDWVPVQGEERLKWLKEWEKTLAETQGGMTTVSHVKELEQTLPKKPAGVNYTPSNGAKGFAEELFEMQQLRAEYARECRDLHTGKLLEGKPEFKDWLKTHK